MSGPTATASIQSPIGQITLKANDRFLLSLKIGLEDQNGRAGEISHPLLGIALDQLHNWFAGALREFDLPLFPLGSEEGKALRAGIAAITYGETMTYGDVAKRTGSIARAVGGACKTNAFPIIIPCHRVVSSSGPEFYSAGDGPRTKGWLLDFENSNLPSDRRTRLL